jgi:hypothetical protein
MKVQRQVTIKLNNPCTEDFDAMPATNCGKFCGSCQKEVVDFSILTDAELIQWLRRYPTSCGMFREDQLNRAITEKIESPLYTPWKAWAAILTLISFFNIYDARAQSKTPATTHQFPETKENANDSVTREIEKMGMRTTNNAASTTGGVYHSANDRLKIGGARTDRTLYIIDGIQVRGNYKRPGLFKRAWNWLSRL